jgi:acyl-CoA thioesterase I
MAFSSWAVLARPRSLSAYNSDRLPGPRTRGPAPGQGGRGMLNAVVLALLAGLCLTHLATPAQAGQVRVLALGDSLTAGYGLAARDALPAVLQEMLINEGLAAQIINAGISGDTTAGARARLGRYLADPPQACILALGANDALRGLDPASAEANLAAILEELNRRGVRTLLVGWGATPDWGRPYAENFNAIYPRLAARFGLDLYPSILAGVSGQPGLTLDGLHPTPQGVRIMAQGLHAQVRRLVLAAQAEIAPPPPGR